MDAVQLTQMPLSFFLIPSRH
uniref:Uncharacterized protein n=1 Tax=Arundo donax TaxID=35708 RepID=A0A0A9BK10_ARUDO